MKQAELSLILGISNSYLSEIENNKKSPSLELLKLYSDCFNIPVSSLLFFSESLSEKDEKVTISKKFKVKSSELILKLLDWSNMIDERKQKEKSR